MSIEMHEVLADCVGKGYEVTFRMPPGSLRVECCIEYPGQFPGAKPFVVADTVVEALFGAAEFAHVPGYRPAVRRSVQP